MATYGYQDNCSTEILPYVCDICPEKDHGRVRGFALIKEGVQFIDISDAVEWANKVDLGEVFLVPNLSGSAVGTEVEGPGKGDTELRIDGYDWVLDLMDENIINACAAWQSASGNKKSRAAWVSDKLIWQSTAVVSVAAVTNIDDDIKSVVNVNAKIKFFEPEMLCPDTKPANTFDRCLTVS